MRLEIALVLSVVLLLAPTADAQSEYQFNFCDSTVKLSENQVRENHTAEYTLLQSSENLSDFIDVKGTISDVRVSDSSGALQFSVEAIEGGFSRLKYFFRGGLSSGERVTVTYEFTNEIRVGTNENSYTISYRWPKAPMTSRIVMELPQGIALLGVSENYSSAYISDNNLNLKWFNVLENSFESEVRFEQSSSPTNENTDGLPSNGLPVSTESQIYVQIIVAFVAVLAAALVILRVHYSRPREPKAVAQPPPEKPSRSDFDKVMRLLTGPESKVISLLLKQDNVTQKTLCQDTEIPKATMSRTIKRLESKGLVKQSGIGAGKRVSLTRWARQWREK